MNNPNRILRIKDISQMLGCSDSASCRYKKIIIDSYVIKSGQVTQWHLKDYFGLK